MIQMMFCADHQHTVCYVSSQDAFWTRTQLLSIESYFTSLDSRACCVLFNMCGDVNSPWNVLWCWFSGSWNCSPAPLILMQVSLWDQQCHLVLRSGGGRRAQMKKGTILNIFSIRDQQLIWRQYNSNALHRLLRLISVSHRYNLSPN